LQKTLPERLNVVRCPIEAYALVIVRRDRRTGSLIEPEMQPLVMNHASDEATVLPHGTIHGQPKPVHPKPQPDNSEELDHLPPNEMRLPCDTFGDSLDGGISQIEERNDCSTNNLEQLTER
jgi:hypothetical protein